MCQSPDERIRLEKNPERVRILYGETIISDSHKALVLRETGYPPRQYLPREDVNMNCLQRSATATHCPFKGDAAWYHVACHNDKIRDVAWSYEDPFQSMEDIREYIAFDSPQLTEFIGDP